MFLLILHKTNHFYYNLMKKIFLLAMGILMAGSAIAAEPVFEVGDRQVSLNIGVGAMYRKGGEPKSPATFDQHLGMEWGVAKFADKFTLGVGFQVNNSYGGKYEGAIMGSYDYSYYERFQSWKWNSSSKRWQLDRNENVTHTRKGTGICEADITREDVGAEIVASLHYSPMSKLDTYFTIGAGAAYQHYLFSNMHNYQGFSKVNIGPNETEVPKVIKTKSSGYSYDDAAHAKFEGYKDHVAPTISAYIGATYFLKDNIGVGAQIGLISNNLRIGKKAYSPHYSIFTVGATYKF